MAQHHQHKHNRLTSSDASDSSYLSLNLFGGDA
jgi:hypothetical protein